MSSGAKSPFIESLQRSRTAFASFPQEVRAQQLPPVIERVNEPVFRHARYESKTEGEWFGHRTRLRVQTEQREPVYEHVEPRQQAAVI